MFKVFCEGEKLRQGLKDIYKIYMKYKNEILTI